MPEQIDSGKILVVDDNENVQKLLCRYLTDNGYEVFAASNGNDGLRLFGTMYPDLILLDVIMPDMSGYDLCQKIRRSPGGENIPVIFISGLLEDREKLRGFELGAVDYLTKPVQREEMLARIHLHLELQRRINELVSFNQIMLEREMRVIELKEEVNTLSAELGRKPPYSEVWKED